MQDMLKNQRNEWRFGDAHSCMDGLSASGHLKSGVGCAGTGVGGGGSGVSFLGATWRRGDILNYIFQKIFWFIEFLSE